MDKLFENDRMTKRERVVATLSHQPLDRCALLGQISCNQRVIEDWTGKRLDSFSWTLNDICKVIRKSLDIVVPPRLACGTEAWKTPDGFIDRTGDLINRCGGRPFFDEHGACAWLKKQTNDILSTSFDAKNEKTLYRARLKSLQRKIGDAVVLDYSSTGFHSIYESMGLEIFTFFQREYPAVFTEFMEVHVALEEKRIHAVASPELSPVILIPEGLATKQGPIFSQKFLGKFYYPDLSRLTSAWHEHGVKVLYHSDGNWKRCIPDLIACGFDGFCCLEKSCGMDIVDLKNAWPQMVWAGGVELLEFNTSEQIRTEVKRHIRETDALRTGGMFVASTRNIAPAIPPENFRALVEAVGESFLQN